MKHTNIQRVIKAKRISDCYGLPLSVYHFGLLINSFTSSTILSATPFSRTTEDKGRRRRGKPKGLHSAPIAVYITVRPSSCFRASSRATDNIMKHKQRHSHVNRNHCIVYQYSKNNFNPCKCYMILSPGFK